MKQKKLFRINPYLKELETEIIDTKDGFILPKETIIFCFSGGQESDTGYINNHKIIECKWENNEILYRVEELDLKKGDKITMKIDWEKRYKLMRLHSAAHIVYFIFKEMTDYTNIIGSNVSSNKARLDYLCDENIKKYIEELEKRVNEFIKEGHTIIMKEDENNKEIMHWVCENYDMLCGGTHVKNTKEIGYVKLKRVNIGKGKERIEIYVN